MPRFENLTYLYLAGLIPLCVLLFFITLQWKKKMKKRFGESQLLSVLLPDISPAKTNFKFILFLLALCMALLVVLNPQTGSRPVKMKRKGAQIIIALDVSNSMKAEDFSPNRLERAKQAISKLIDKLQGDEIGLVVFAGKAYVQLPVTTDYAAAKLVLDDIDTDIVPTQGTSLEEAINFSLESFVGDESKNKALIIITDGEDHEGGAVEAAAKASKKGVIIHTIGMGSPNGVPIPAFQNNVRTGYRKDREGNTIITKLNEQILKEIAGAGHGLYIHANNTDVGLDNLLGEISKLDKSEFTGQDFEDYDNYFPFFAWAALLILIIEELFSERRSELYERLNLFGERK